MSPTSAGGGYLVPMTYDCCLGRCRGLPDYWTGAFVAEYICTFVKTPRKENTETFSLNNLGVITR